MRILKGGNISINEKYAVPYETEGQNDCFALLKQDAEKFMVFLNKGLQLINYVI